MILDSLQQEAVQLREEHLANIERLTFEYHKKLAINFYQQVDIKISKTYCMSWGPEYNDAQHYFNMFEELYYLVNTDFVNDSFERHYINTLKMRNLFKVLGLPPEANFHRKYIFEQDYKVTIEDLKKINLIVNAKGYFNSTVKYGLFEQEAKDLAKGYLDSNHPNLKYQDLDAYEKIFLEKQDGFILSEDCPELFNQLFNQEVSPAALALNILIAKTFNYELDQESIRAD